VYKNNLSLCVKLEDTEIKSMVDLAAQHHCEELMDLLYHVVKIPKDDMPVKHNQQLVIKYIMQQRNDILTLTRPDERQRLAGLLEAVCPLQSKFGHGWLVSQLMCARAPQIFNPFRCLAFCRALASAKRKRPSWRTTWSLCACSPRAVRAITATSSPCAKTSLPCTIFCRYEARAVDCSSRVQLTANALSGCFKFTMTQILTNDQIPMTSRQPYLRFLLWAYINADAENDKYNIRDIQYEPALWTFMDMLAKHIHAVARQVRRTAHARL